jgi:hypothetical protein
MQFVLLIITILIGYFIVRGRMNLSFMVKQFERNNVVVFGKKGAGKDMLFQQIINARNKFHYSNISYGKKTLPIVMNDISLWPNTYENMINGQIEKIKPNLNERYDIYISDAGVMLPSQYDWLLHKKYPSLPLLYALQRHLYASNMHVNVQSLGRVWKPIRELADGYIQCERVIWLGPIYIQFVTYYDRYNSAEQSLLPMKRRIINGMSDAIADQYIATNGLIKPMYLIGTKKRIKYDTRYFRNVFFLKPTGHPDAIAADGIESVSDKNNNASVGSITHRD